ncbi:hypothetical protein WFJ45_24200, partial [Salmonella enterica subsp. enterica serovar Minnesota]|uniref:hypothetical protein n=1 Tax=Salmonella enterica TaxID=28901 RepID=UPI003D292EC0
LAEKAGTIKADAGRPLAAWLLQVTRYAAANARRRAARRVYHERRAAEMARREAEADAGSSWDEYSPLLDEGIGKLRAKDRDAIVL